MLVLKSRVDCVPRLEWWLGHIVPFLGTQIPKPCSSRCPLFKDVFTNRK